MPSIMSRAHGQALASPRRRSACHGMPIGRDFGRSQQSRCRRAPKRARVGGARHTRGACHDRDADTRDAVKVNRPRFPIAARYVLPRRDRPRDSLFAPPSFQADAQKSKLWRSLAPAVGSSCCCYVVVRRSRMALCLRLCLANAPQHARTLQNSQRFSC